MKVKPVLLTDCDGVLLQWLAHTPSFVEDLGFDSAHLKDVMRGNQFIHFSDVFCANNDKEAWDRLNRYNESHYMKSLPVIEAESVGVINRLSEDYDIIVITSYSASPIAKENRKENLELHFGNSISDLICLEPQADKTAVIKDIAKDRDVHMWVDDQIKHVHHGVDAGVPSFQYSYGMDCGRNTGEVNEMNSWLEIESHLRKIKLRNMVVPSI